MGKKVILIKRRGIGYATAPRGGCHMSAFPIEAEAFGDLDPFTFEGKAKLVAELK
jgi:aldehyde:ferredoxin oxidoreductase